MNVPWKISLVISWILATPILAGGHDLPEYVLPPGVSSDAVIGVSPTFNATSEELMRGEGLSLLQQTYPDYEPMSGVANGGIWIGNPDGLPRLKDYGQANFVYVTVDEELVCFQVSSAERLEDFFPVLP